MNPEARRLHRLRYETMDWCAAVRGHPIMRTHDPEQSINHRPEVWD